MPTATRNAPTTSAWSGGPTRRGTSRRWSASPAATSSCRCPPCTAAWSRSTPASSAGCRDDLARRLRGKPATKAELLDEERAALLPLPAEAFVAARVEPRRADSLSLVRFDANDYSVPTELRPPPGHGRRRRWTRSGSSPATAWWPTTAGAGAASRSPTTRCTTWPCWSASPGRWTSPRPLEGWELPVCFGVLRRRLEAEFGGPGTRQFIKVLRLLERAEPGGADPGRRAGAGAGRRPTPTRCG